VIRNEYLAFQPWLGRWKGDGGTEGGTVQRKEPPQKPRVDRAARSSFANRSIVWPRRGDKSQWTIPRLIYRGQSRSCGPLFASCRSPANSTSRSSTHASRMFLTVYNGIVSNPMSTGSLHNVAFSPRPVKDITMRPMSTRKSCGPMVVTQGLGCHAA
jgi:hypothetical protein